ncbi:MAG: CBS and ACT domain-containing protein [Desulfobacterium sp.]|jgi:acetoin utilization protein AcuB|nr:CBS and ACT domain-containing protein [Desulfobacterium sp.]
MLVKHWMAKNVISVDADCTLEIAIALMKTNKIRMIPVLKNGGLTGVITDRDLKRASASDAVKASHADLAALAQIKVKTIMTRNPIHVPYDFSIDETAELLLEHKISGAPVLDDMDNLVGVITQTNLYKALISLTGKRKDSIQVGVVIRDTRNVIGEINELILYYGGRIISMLTSDDNMPRGYRKVFIRLGGIGRVRLQSIIDELETKGELIYVIDHHDNIRMVYK